MTKHKLTVALEALAEITKLQNYHDKADAKRIAFTALEAVGNAPDATEQAFRAAYKIAAERARAFHPMRIESGVAHLESSWSAYADEQAKRS